MKTRSIRRSEKLYYSNRGDRDCRAAHKSHSGWVMTYRSGRQCGGYLMSKVGWPKNGSDTCSNWWAHCLDCMTSTPQLTLSSRGYTSMPGPQ